MGLTDWIFDRLYAAGYHRLLNQIQVQTWSSACGKTPDPGLDLV